MRGRRRGLGLPRRACYVRFKTGEIYLSGSFIVRQHGGFWHFSWVLWTFGPMRQNFIPLGGGMCILFEICEKEPFQKIMGWVGGR